VDISETVSSVKGAEMAYLRDDILAVLRINTTISQVRLDTTRLDQVNGQEVYGSFVDFIDNPDARHPLTSAWH
jgi:hypothetical protein